MKKNLKINTVKLLAGTMIVTSSFAGGGSTDLAKDLSSAVVSSVGSIFEPVEVYAAIEEVELANGFKVKFDDVNCTITTYISGNGDLVIPAEINGQPVRTINKNAFKNATAIRSLTIPSTLNTIGESAFEGCTSLKTINIPDKNELDTISKSAFINCTALEKIVIPTGVKTIAESVFMNCTALTSVSLPNSVTSIGIAAFRGCTALTSIVIPNKVTSLGTNAFYACKSLVDVKFPNSLTSIGNGAFQYCSSLKSITLPNSVNSLGESAFADCTGLQDVVLSTNITGIPNRAFDECSNLVNITMPSISGVGSWAFYKASALSNIYYGGSDWEDVSKSSYSFSDTGKYTVHPNSKMPETPEETPLLFDDIYLDSYFTSAIEYMVGNNFMGGKNDYTFDPLANLTRAELVTILYNADGKPTTGKSTFGDSSTHWASNAINWANENGLVNGNTASNTFSPDGVLTKQDLAIILQRYYDYKDLSLSTSNSTTIYDTNNADGYAQDGINNLAQVGIIDSNVLSDGKYEPKESATRAEATYLMYNLLNN